MVRLWVIGFGLLALAGCTDLTAVAQFAQSGSAATTATDVFQGYKEATIYGRRHAAPPVDTALHAEHKRAAVALRQAKAAQKPWIALDDKAQALADGNDAGLRALSLYLSTLASLAADSAVDVKASADSIAGSLQKLGAVSSASAGPAGSLIQFLLKAPLDAWRNRAVGKLITGANGDVMTLCTDLAIDADAVANTWRSDIALAGAYYGGIPGTAGDLRGAALMDSLARQDVAAFRPRAQKAAALAVALRKVCDGQAKMNESAGSLDAETIKAVLAGYRSEIEDAARLIRQ